MDNFYEILRLGFVDGLVWFPFVLGIGLLYKHFKVIDVSIDGTTVISGIACALVWIHTRSYSLSIAAATLTAIAGYSVMWVLITHLRVNSILAGVLYSLIMHALSVILIGESVVLNGTNLFASFFDISLIPMVVMALTAMGSELFYRSNIGTTTRLVGSTPAPNSRYNPQVLTWVGFCVTGLVVGLGAGIYVHRQGVSRAGGGFEFLVTGLSSFLVVDRLIELITSALNRARSEKQRTLSTNWSARYWAHNVIHSVAFKALVGSILFQIAVLLVISKTPNPSYWKLFLGLVLLLSVARFAFVKRKLSAKHISEPAVEGVMLSNINLEYELGYEKRAVFKGMSVWFPPGINLVWGPNGAGKSSLLGIINGTISAQDGKLFINNKDVTQLPPHKRVAYMLTQNPHRSVADDLSVYENLIAVGQHGKSILSLTSPGAVLNSLNTYLARLGLGDLVKGKEGIWLQESGKLSGGQLQRLALYMALLSKSDVILADEPTSGLDEENLKRLIVIFQQLASAKKILIITTHDARLNNLEGRHYKIDGGNVIPLSEGPPLFANERIYA
jgi:putative ABC transport system ATP-binding protein